MKVGLFTPRVTRESALFDFMYTQPPAGTDDPIEVLEMAHGLRPQTDLEPRIWLDTNSSLAKLVDG